MPDITARFRLTREATPNAEEFRLKVDLTLPGSGVTAIFGHSGCGKTTLLRCIAGLEQTNEGFLSVDNEVWQDRNQYLPVHRRSLGYVFQQPSLFPHLNVKDNLAFAIKRSGKPPDPRLYSQTINTLAISEKLCHAVQQLSGGEQQRVVIARAILMQPQLLLMDEPLASLDQWHKHEILPYLEQLTWELNAPLIYVSHSVDEITQLADHAVVMHHGSVTASGSVTDVFSQAGITGLNRHEDGVVWQGRITSIDENWHLMKIDVGNGDLWLPLKKQVAIGNRIKIRLLAKDISLSLAPDTLSTVCNRLFATVIELHPQGKAMMLVKLMVGEKHLLAQVTQRSVSQLGLKPGTELWAQIKSAAITV